MSKTYCLAPAKTAIKTGHYSSPKVEMHHVRRETPGACMLPRERMRRGAVPGSTGGGKCTLEKAIEG